MNIYIDHNKNYEIVMQDHGPHPRRTNDEEILHRSQGHDLAWVPVYDYCGKRDFYGHCSDGNNQRQGH